MPQTGDGPFQRGERLTARKLNDLARGIPTFVAGGSLTESPAGKLIHIDQNENIYIKLTGKSGTSPIKYAWKEVVRLANGTWLDTTRTANTTDDYAIELNNSNLSTTDNYIYRAERSTHTGEWLFFLRRRAAAGSIRVFLSLTDGLKSGCAMSGLLSFSGPTAFSASAPDRYRVASMTLRMQDYAGTWTTLKTWTEQSDSTWANYTFTPPYTPSVSQPLTLELTGTTANGTVLGRLPLTCVASTLCGTTIATDLTDNQGAPQSYFYGPVAGNITGNTTTLTALSNVTMVAKVNATGSLTLPSGSINGPASYNFQMSWSSDTGNSTDVLGFINANYSASFGPGSPSDGGSATSSVTEFHGGLSIRRYGQASSQIGFTVNDNWTTPGAWPTSNLTYTYGILRESAQCRADIGSTRSVAVSAVNTYHGNAATSFSTLSLAPGTPSTFTDGTNIYTVASGTATPSGSC